MLGSRNDEGDTLLGRKKSTELSLFRIEMSNAFRLFAGYMVHISCFTGGIAETNGYLVENSRGRFVVDAPEGFAGWLGQRGVESVDALLLTHLHFDHCQDAAAVKRE